MLLLLYLFFQSCPIGQAAIAPARDNIAPVVLSSPVISPWQGGQPKAHDFDPNLKL